MLHLAEDKIFEANEAAQRAEEDAIQADKDAERFERKWKQSVAEVKELRAALAKTQAQLAEKPVPASPATPAVAIPANEVTSPATQHDNHNDQPHQEPKTQGNDEAATTFVPPSPQIKDNEPKAQLHSAATIETAPVTTAVEKQLEALVTPSQPSSEPAVKKPNLPMPVSHAKDHKPPQSAATTSTQGTSTTSSAAATIATIFGMPRGEEGEGGAS